MWLGAAGPRPSPRRNRSSSSLLNPLVNRSERAGGERRGGRALGSPPPPRALGKRRGVDPLPAASLLPLPSSPAPPPPSAPPAPPPAPGAPTPPPPHVTRQRAMQIAAAAGSHWPRRAHLMAARARRMAAGPRAPPAPRAPPLRAHGPGQAAGSASRARPPRSQALSARLRSLRGPRPPSPAAP